MYNGGRKLETIIMLAWIAYPLPEEAWLTFNKYVCVAIVMEIYNATVATPQQTKSSIMIDLLRFCQNLVHKNRTLWVVGKVV